MFDTEKIKSDFPILQQKINNYPLVYLDNGATSQKPQSVIKAMNDYYEQYNANVHRGLHFLSEKATSAYEGARTVIANFIHAKNEKEIIYTKNATDGYNHVAGLLAKNVLQKGDTILLSLSEHHSNIVPWQLLAKEKGYNLEYINIDGEGNFDLKDFENKIQNNVKVVSVQHVSNVTGIIHPIKTIIEKAKKVNAITIIDGSQSVPHISIDVQDLDCDFFIFTAHKMLGPTGFGVLYGKEKWLEKFEPIWGGGDMISEVHKEYSTWNQLPWKFEPGTPNIVGAIGTQTAIEYLEKIGLDNIAWHEKELTTYALKKLQEIPSLHIIGPKTAERKIGVVAFTLENIHPHDIAALLDQKGIAIRVGHHCAQLLHKTLGIFASARISMYLYNTKEEIDVTVEELKNIVKMFE